MARARSMEVIARTVDQLVTVTNNLSRDAVKFREHMIFCEEREKKRDEQHKENKQEIHGLSRRISALIGVGLTIAGGFVLVLLTLVGFGLAEMFHKVFDGG